MEEAVGGGGVIFVQNSVPTFGGFTRGYTPAYTVFSSFPFADISFIKIFRCPQKQVNSNIEIGYMFYVRKTLLNIASVAISDVVNRGFFFLFNIVIARSLQPEQFGNYSLAITVGVWLWCLTDAGLSVHGTKLAAQGNDLSYVVSRIIGSRIITFFISSLLCIYMVNVLAIPFSDLLMCMAVLLYVAGMCLFPAWVPLSKHDNIGYALSYFSIVVIGMAILSAYVFGVLPHNGLSALLARNSAWLAGSIISLFIIMNRLRFRLNFIVDINLLTRTLPLGGAAIFYTLIPLIPFIFMRIHGWELWVGQYGAIWQIQQILIVIASIIAAVFLPTYAKTLGRGYNKFILNHFVMIFVIATLICSLYWLMGPSFIKLLYGRNYMHASEFLSPFALALFFIFFRVSLDSILISHGKYKLMLTNSVAAALFVAVLSIGYASSPAYLAWYYMAGEGLLLFFICIFTIRNLYTAKS